MNDRTARRMWQLYEPIHDVTYFTPEARTAAAAVIDSGTLPASNPVGLTVNRYE